jgi:hypothetical protein
MYVPMATGARRIEFVFYSKIEFCFLAKFTPILGNIEDTPCILSRWDTRNVCLLFLSLSATAFPPARPPARQADNAHASHARDTQWQTHGTGGMHGGWLHFRGKGKQVTLMTNDLT